MFEHQDGAGAIRTAAQFTTCYATVFASKVLQGFVCQNKVAQQLLPEVMLTPKHNHSPHSIHKWSMPRT